MQNINFDQLNDNELKECILALTREFSRRKHTANRPGYEETDRDFIPGVTPIPYAGRVFTEDEVEAAVSSTLDFWLTLGPEGDQFETKLAEFLNVRKSLLVNSGSSANLVAISALTSHKLPREKRLLPGDEVITVAAGFPTTVAPILQNGLVAVFLDAAPITGNVRLDRLDEAFVPGKTKAIMIAHALGNPFDLSRILSFCKEHDLWLIEDKCDALGCSYTIPADSPLVADYPKEPRNPDGSLTKYTGSWGDLSTQSFYPPHHLTMGEGGAVNIVRQAALKVLVESFRDWGRDCWCPSGKTTLATNDSHGNWENYPTGTITSTSIRTLATTSSRLIRRRPSDVYSSKSSLPSSKLGKTTGRRFERDLHP